MAHWGSEGAAVLSVPTREYFQSSGWVDTSTASTIPNAATASNVAQSSMPPENRAGEALSVRSGSDFWAGGHHTESSGEFTAAQLSSSPDPQSPVMARAQAERRRQRTRPSPGSDSDSSDSDGTQIAAGRAQAGNAAPNSSGGGAAPNPGVVDEAGAQDAFVAGMMYALSRRLVPGDPYTPSAVTKDGADADREKDRGRWRLEECLRYA